MRKCHSRINVVLQLLDAAQHSNTMMANDLQAAASNSGARANLGLLAAPCEIRIRAHLGRAFFQRNGQDIEDHAFFPSLRHCIAIHSSLCISMKA